MKERARFENPTAIFEIRYTWFPEPEKEQQATLYKSLGIKTGPMEDIDIILGIPLSFAIFIIPGLMALILFGAFVPLPKVIDDNIYLAGFLLSMIGLFLMQYIGYIHLRAGISQIDLLIFTGAGSILGAVVGYSYKYRKWKHLPGYERYPPPPTKNLGVLLATYVRQTDSVESIPYRLRLSNGKEYSGLRVMERNGQEVILLPRTYKVIGDDKLVRKLKDDYTKKKVYSVAKLLEQVGDRLQVNDGSKEIREGKEERFDGSDRPKEFKSDEIKGWDHERRKELLIFNMS